jgi:hypothetical protein
MEWNVLRVPCCGIWIRDGVGRNGTNATDGTKGIYGRLELRAERKG